MEDDIEVEVEIKIEGKDEEVPQVFLDFEKFMLYSKEEDDQSDDGTVKKFKLYSQELLDNCTLSYTIFDQNTQFTRWKQ